MKKLLLICLAVIILLMDFAALDDITTGNELSFSGEYLILIISIPALLVIGCRLLGKKLRSP